MKWLNMLHNFNLIDSHHATFQRKYRVESIYGIRTYSIGDVGFWPGFMDGRPVAVADWKSLPPLNAVYVDASEMVLGLNMKIDVKWDNLFVRPIRFSFYAGEKNIFPICRLLSCIEWGSYN